MAIFKIVGFLLLTLLIPVDAHQYEGWLSQLREIKLLKTGLNEVVKIYGQPEEPDMFGHREFVTKDGTLFIKISTGRCGTRAKRGWDVDRDIVESFSFELKGRFKPKDLDLDIGQFDRSEVFDQPGAYYYESKKLGMDLFVNKRGYVQLLEFYPDEALASKFRYCG